MIKHLLIKINLQEKYFNINQIKKLTFKINKNNQKKLYVKFSI